MRLRNNEHRTSCPSLPSSLDYLKNMHLSGVKTFLKFGRINEGTLYIWKVWEQRIQHLKQTKKMTWEKNVISSEVCD